MLSFHCHLWSWVFISKNAKLQGLFSKISVVFPNSLMFHSKNRILHSQFSYLYLTKCESKGYKQMQTWFCFYMNLLPNANSISHLNMRTKKIKMRILFDCELIQKKFEHTPVLWLQACESINPSIDSSFSISSTNNQFRTINPSQIESKIETQMRFYKSICSFITSINTK